MPRGRDAVRAALVAAATRLFADRGPAAVSVRDLAAEAGVNHGLVHRHFGSKEGLLAVVMTDLAGQVQDALGEAAEDESLGDLVQRIAAATEQVESYWRILARVILEGRDPAELQQGFPVMGRIMAAARRQATNQADADAGVVMLAAFALGMRTFEPYLQVATGRKGKRWCSVRDGAWRRAVAAASGAAPG